MSPSDTLVIICIQGKLQRKYFILKFSFVCKLKSLRVMHFLSLKYTHTHTVFCDTSVPTWRQAFLFAQAQWVCHLLSPAPPSLGSMVSCWPFLLPKGLPPPLVGLGSLGGSRAERVIASLLPGSSECCVVQGQSFAPLPTYSGPAIEQSSRAQPDLLYWFCFPESSLFNGKTLPSPSFLKLICLISM